VVAVLQCDEAAVSLAIEEVGAADWAARVFRPEILDNPNLYKRPGYNPLA
jgi:4-oxalocrotonate tautomerase